jgi:hypothetical protein
MTVGRYVVFLDRLLAMLEGRTAERRLAERYVLWTAASMILVRRHPDADVPWTIAKDNAIAGFAVAQGANGVTIGEDQVREVQHHDGTDRFSVDQLTELAYVFRVESTAHGEHHGSIHRSLNLQQRHDRA